MSQNQFADDMSLECYNITLRPRREAEYVNEVFMLSAGVVAVSGSRSFQSAEQELPFSSPAAIGQNTRARTMCEQALRQGRLFQLERWRTVFDTNVSSRANAAMWGLGLLELCFWLYG